MAMMNGKRLMHRLSNANGVRVRNLIFRKMFYAIRIILASLSKSMNVFINLRSSSYLDQIKSSYLYCTY